MAGGLTIRLVSGLLTDFFGWRIPFLLFGLLTLLAALWMARTLTRDQPTTRNTGWLQAYRGMLTHLGNRRLAGAFLIGGSLFFGFIASFTYLPY